LAVAPPHLRALIVLLAETGIRSGKEALPLKWEDVDLQNGTLYVRESKTRAGVRMVPLSNLCKAELVRWKELMGPDYSPYVFPNPSDTSVHLQCVRKPWVTALKKAKIPSFPIYNLRATFASRLSAAGLPDNLVAGMIGHSNASILPTYAKILDEYRRDAIQKLEAYRLEHQN
jgi:integrase